MNNTIEYVTATRGYLLLDEPAVKCDNCKGFAMKAFKLVPPVQTHAFHDDIIVCYNCVTKLKLLFSVDIDEIIKAGGVTEWLKVQKKL